MDVQPAMEIFSVIGDDEGEPPPAPPEVLDADLLNRMYRAMVLLRTFDERAVALQRQGRIGTYPPFWGEEGNQVGAFLACRDTDWIFPSYRQSALGMLRGIPASTYLKYRRGYGGVHGFWNPRDHRVAPSCVPIGTHLPHAVGLAWAAQIAGDDVAALVFFGDGATSEGDFHEAMNIAAVRRVGTVFFCVNNQWAISTPFSRQTASATVAEKAAAYGMAGVRVDGFDPLACYEATRAALRRARSGEGPTLIEAFCYRIGPHGTADDPARYRDPTEAEAWKEREPVGRLGRYLRRRGILDDAGVEDAQRAARAEIDRAVADLEACDAPTTDVLFDHLYASERPWTLEAPRAQLRYPRPQALGLDSG
jgi:TPP-dependent pyruvate/acetoin dehydrogenase alpha subunit